MSARTKRKRRQLRALLQHGLGAKPRHTLKSGRTGIAHSKKSKSKQDGIGVVSREFKLRTRVEPLEELKYESASEAVAEMRRSKRRK